MSTSQNSTQGIRKARDLYKEHVVVLRFPSKTGSVSSPPSPILGKQQGKRKDNNREPCESCAGAKVKCEYEPLPGPVRLCKRCIRLKRFCIPKVKAEKDPPKKKRNHRRIASANAVVGTAVTQERLGETSQPCATGQDLMAGPSANTMNGGLPLFLPPTGLPQQIALPVGEFMYSDVDFFAISQFPSDVGYSNDLSNEDRRLPMYGQEFQSSIPVAQVPTTSGTYVEGVPTPQPDQQALEAFYGYDTSTQYYY